MAERPKRETGTELTDRVRRAGSRVPSRPANPPRRPWAQPREPSKPRRGPWAPPGTRPLRRQSEQVRSECDPPVAEVAERRFRVADTIRPHVDLTLAEMDTPSAAADDYILLQLTSSIPASDAGTLPFTRAQQRRGWRVQGWAAVVLTGIAAVGLTLALSLGHGPRRASGSGSPIPVAPVERVDSAALAPGERPLTSMTGLSAVVAPEERPPMVALSPRATVDAHTRAPSGGGSAEPSPPLDRTTTLRAHVPSEPRNRPAQRDALPLLAERVTGGLPRVELADPPTALRVDIAPEDDRAPLAPQPLEPPGSPVPSIDGQPGSAEESPSRSELPVTAAPFRVETPPAAALASAQEDLDRISGVLERFQLAYRELDAGAAKAIWPGVNQRALARAFDGLESQDLAFERCDLTVTGPDAKAACRGYATYVPRVGSKTPWIVSRQWTFQLKKGDAGWVITGAETR